MLTFALFMSARMGIYQEQVYAKYGKHPKEALFYNVSVITLEYKVFLSHQYVRLGSKGEGRVIMAFSISLKVLSTNES